MTSSKRASLDLPRPASSSLSFLYRPLSVIGSPKPLPPHHLTTQETGTYNECLCRGLNAEPPINS